WDEEVMLEIISYAQLQGVDIVSMREAWEMFGNHVEITDKNGFKAIIDADGESNFGDIFTNDNLPTNNTPITAFPKNRVTRQRLRMADVEAGDLPFPNGGLLETHHFSDWYVSKQVFTLSPLLSND